MQRSNEKPKGHWVNETHFRMCAATEAEQGEMARKLGRDARYWNLQRLRLTRRTVEKRWLPDRLPRR